jgi:hypothetical protein
VVIAPTNAAPIQPANDNVATSSPYTLHSHTLTITITITHVARRSIAAEDLPTRGPACCVWGLLRGLLLGESAIRGGSQAIGCRIRETRHSARRPSPTRCRSISEVAYHGLIRWSNAATSPHLSSGTYQEQRVRQRACRGHLRERGCFPFHAAPQQHDLRG